MKPSVPVRYGIKTAREKQETKSKRCWGLNAGPSVCKACSLTLSSAFMKLPYAGSDPSGPCCQLRLGGHSSASHQTIVFPILIPLRTF